MPTQSPLFDLDENKSSVSKKRKSPEGDTLTNLVMTSHLGENAALFAQILSLHVAKGSKIADVTYGKGAFWRGVASTDYVVLQSDLKTGVDCRKLPYKNAELDCVVLDPPYMEGLYRNDDSMAGQGTHRAFQKSYSNSTRPLDIESKWHDAVLEMYVQAAVEAKRVLHANGTLIVKCQDEVSAGVQRLTHIEIVLNYQQLGFYAKDLFVLTRLNRPVVSRVKRQIHARKNHSYFIVFVKGATKSKQNSIMLMKHLLNSPAEQTDCQNKEAEADK